LRSTIINLQDIQKRLQETLQHAGDDTPGNTSLVLLSHILKQPKAWALAHTDYQPTESEQQKLSQIVGEFLAGVPLPYLLGSWEFYGRSFRVTPDVLIPRPETEQLVEKALQHINYMNNPLILDIGTGSGAIAISLAAEAPLAQVIATDISRAALTIARENATMLKQDRVLFIQADLLPPINRTADIICANLPYIPTQILQTLKVFHREPCLALDGGEDGLAHIKRLLHQAQTRLAKPGVILLEIEAGQGQVVLSAARKAFPHASVHLHQDFQGRDRLIEIHSG
jgi:release factor glutamine methyltransferase